MFIFKGFFYYIILVILAAFLTARFAVPRWGNTQVAVYIFICSVIGSLSVMMCKGIGLIIREWLSGSIGKSYIGIFIMLVLTLVICISVQMVYLNKALDIFPTGIVKPVYYIFFTTSVMVASAILFQEWQHMTVINIIGIVCGFLVVIVALFMMNGFRDLRISLIDLYPVKATKRHQTSP
jgi:magnesium transporter